MSSRPVSIRLAWRKWRSESISGKALASSSLNSGDPFMMVKLFAIGALGAFAVAGPLQHLNVLPQTAFGDASKASIKAVLNVGATEAFAACGGGGGGGG